MTCLLTVILLQLIAFGLCEECVLNGEGATTVDVDSNGRGRVPVIVENLGEWQVEVAHFLKEIMQAGETYFELDPLTGYNFYEMSNHLEEMGLAFGFVQDTETFEKISNKGFKSTYQSMLATGQLEFLEENSSATIDNLVV